MNILITGAKGFVGRNLVENLKTLADGRNKTRPDLHITKIYEYDIDNTEAELDKFCSDCDFVFNLAGVNRPKDNSEFQAGNFGFASKLLTLLKKHGNLCPVMLSSSIQASLVGRFADSEYGRSKLAKFMFTASLTWPVNGANRIIIPLWRHSVIILLTICQ